MAGLIAATVVTGIGGALLASDAASSAADKQIQASKDAQAAQERMYQQQVALQAPFREAGLTAQNKMMSYLGLAGDTNAPGYGKYAGDFSMADYTADPGYQFRMDQGMQALQRSAAARGGLLSGSTMKGIERFGQGLASEEYQNAFNRYQTNRSNQLGALQGLINTGTGATNTLTGAAGAQGQNQANAINAQGYYAGTAAAQSGNAWGNAFGKIGDTLGSIATRSGIYSAPVTASNYGYSPAGVNTDVLNYGVTNLNAPISYAGLG